MQNRNKTGGVWATRFMLFLSAAALCSLLVASPVGAQQGDKPTITIDSLQEDSCPGKATLTVLYVAEASNGVGLINVKATSDTSGEELSSDLVLDSVAATYTGSAVFDLTGKGDSTWTVTAKVFDGKNQEAIAEGSITVAQDSECGPTVALGNVELSGKVCPDPVKLSVPYTAEASAGLRSVTVEATSAVDGTEADVSQRTELDGSNPAKTLSDTTVFDIPADTQSSTWTVTVSVTDVNAKTALAVTTVDLVANPGCVDDGDPSIKIQDVKAAGPLCPGGTEVAANIVLENIKGSVTLTGTIEGSGGYSLKGDPVTITADGTRQTVPWKIELPVDAPGGKLALVVQAMGDTWGTATAGSFMVEKDPDPCVGDAGVVVTIDKTQVCPSAKTVSVLVSALADAGLKSLVVRSDLFERPQSVSIVEGTKTLKKDVIFAIPASAKPGTYQLVAEAADATGNTSLAYQDFTLGSADDCSVTPTATPMPPATPTPTPGVYMTPTPTPGVYMTPTPTPGVHVPPTPTPGNQIVHKPATATPTPTPTPHDSKKPGDSGGKPGSLAFTGRNSVALALGGFILIATGLAVAWDPRSRSFGRRR